MAIMHPQNLNNYDPTESEKVFFDALKDQLDNSYHVFYSVKWYGTDSKGNRVNSECNFLVFSPDFGYLTIEVKGGKQIEVNDRHWILYYSDQNGAPTQRDLGKGPYAQADKSMYYFYDYYKKETLSKFQGSYGMAVAFPFFNLDTELENDAPRELTIQLCDMDNLRNRINEIFHYWRKRNQGTFLSNSQAEKFISLVNKRVALTVAAGALIPITERKLETINIVQDSIVSMLNNYRKIQIVGGAGTGKTWIAIKKIRQQSLLGKKCLFISYNPSLVEFVKKQIDGQDCYSIEGLFSLFATPKEVNQYELDPNGDICYYDRFRTKMLPKYDCIIVDEAQDCTEDWAKTVTLFLKSDGILWIFYDENQNVYKRGFGNGFAIDTEPYLLINNIRNTQNIHSWIKEKTQMGEQIISNDVCGCDPEVHNYQTRQQAELFVNSVLLQLISEEGVDPQSIVVLTNDNDYDNWNNKVLGQYTLSKNTQNGALDIKLASVSEFKGLEASVVIYLDNWPNSIPKNQEYYNRLYVAGTRAKYYLYIVSY